MKLAQFIAETFGFDPQSTSAASVVNESDVRKSLALTAVEKTLARQKDAAVVVVESDGAMAVIGEKFAVCLRADGSVDSAAVPDDLELDEVSKGAPKNNKCAVCGGKFVKNKKGDYVCDKCGDDPGSPEQYTAARHGKDKIKNESNKSGSVWARFGDGGDYEDLGDELYAVATALVDNDVANPVSWQKMGLSCAGYRGDNYVSIYWGKTAEDPSRELNANEKRQIEEFLDSIEKDESVDEVLGYSVKAKDKRIISAFVNGDTEGEGAVLTIDGDMLTAAYHGSNDPYATRDKNGKITVGTAYGNVSQTIVNAIRKAAKEAGALAESLDEAGGGVTFTFSDEKSYARACDAVGLNKGNDYSLLNGAVEGHTTATRGSAIYGSISVDGDMAFAVKEALKRSSVKYALRESVDFGVDEARMTKQHFVAIAARIKNDDRLLKPMKAKAAKLLGDFFAQFNPNFNHDTWMRACGVTGDLAKEDAEPSEESIGVDEASVTKKHFIAVAELLRNDDSIALKYKIIIADIIADVFQQMNPRFQRDTFIRAIKVSTGAVDKASDAADAAAEEAELLACLDGVEEGVVGKVLGFFKKKKGKGAPAGPRVRRYGQYARRKSAWQESRGDTADVKGMIEGLEKLLAVHAPERALEIKEQWDAAKADYDVDAALTMIADAVTTDDGKAALDEYKRMKSATYQKLMRSRRTKTSAEKMRNRFAKKLYKRTRAQVIRKKRIYVRKFKNRFRESIEAIGGPARFITAASHILERCGVETDITIEADGTLLLHAPQAEMDGLFAYLDGETATLAEALDIAVTQCNSITEADDDEEGDAPEDDGGGEDDKPSDGKPDDELKTQCQAMADDEGVECAVVYYKEDDEFECMTKDEADDEEDGKVVYTAEPSGENDDTDADDQEESVDEAELSVPQQHQLKIAKKTLKMSDAGANIMGGMNKEEARKFLKSIGYTDKQIAKLEESVLSDGETDLNDLAFDIVSRVANGKTNRIVSDGLLSKAEFQRLDIDKISDEIGLHDNERVAKIVAKRLARLQQESIEEAKKRKAAKKKKDDGFDGDKRWGNSAIKGVGVNSPAMMKARAGFAKGESVEDEYRRPFVDEAKLRGKVDLPFGAQVDQNRKQREGTGTAKITPAVHALIDATFATANGSTITNVAAAVEKQEVSVSKPMGRMGSRHYTITPFGDYFMVLDDNGGVGKSTKSFYPAADNLKESDDENIDVVFRVWKDSEDVIALFKNVPETKPGTVLSYEHVGQHGAADYKGVLKDTRKAKPAEFAPLKKELEQIGYTVTVVSESVNEEDEGDPEEDDITTEDDNKWYQSGKLYHTGDRASLKRKMDKDNYWPNVWVISDHGNSCLISGKKNWWKESVDESKTGVMRDDVSQVGTSLKLKKGQKVRIEKASNLPAPKNKTHVFAAPADGSWGDDSILISLDDLEDRESFWKSVGRENRKRYPGESVEESVTAKELKQCVDAYIECALWSSTDNSDDRGGDALDKNYSASDVASKARIGATEDCRHFLAANENFIAQAMEDDDSYDYAGVGHDLWLSRNGHGAGFFDHKGGAMCWKLLQAAARKLGECNPYVGDDGEVYGLGESLDEAKSANQLRKMQADVPVSLRTDAFNRVLDMIDNGADADEIATQIEAAQNRLDVKQQKFLKARAEQNESLDEAKVKLVCLECGKKWTGSTEKDNECPKCGGVDYEVDESWLGEGGGVSPGQRKGLIYRAMQKIQRDLVKAGVPAEKSGKMKSGDLVGDGWKAFMASVGPASNAEMMFYPVLQVSGKDYHDFTTSGKKRDGSMEDGIAAVKALAGDASESDVSEKGVPDWKSTAKKLIDANEGTTEEDLGYRAYLRAIIDGNEAQAIHLRKMGGDKAKGANKAMSDLIDKTESVDEAGVDTSAEPDETDKGEAVLDKGLTRVEKKGRAWWWIPGTNLAINQTLMGDVNAWRFEITYGSGALKSDKSAFLVVPTWSSYGFENLSGMPLNPAIAEKIIKFLKAEAKPIKDTMKPVMEKAAAAAKEKGIEFTSAAQSAALDAMVKMAQARMHGDRLRYNGAWIDFTTGKATAKKSVYGESVDEDASADDLNESDEIINEAKQQGINAAAIKSTFKVDDKVAKQIVDNIKAAGGDESAESTMDFINTVTNENGVETVNGDGPGGFWRDAVLLYVNRGDTYDTTICYDTTKEQFFLGSWGDWVERFGEKMHVESVDESNRIPPGMIPCKVHTEAGGNLWVVKLGGKGKGKELTFQSDWDQASFAANAAGGLEAPDDWDEKPSTLPGWEDFDPDDIYACSDEYLRMAEDVDEAKGTGKARVDYWRTTEGGHRVGFQGKPGKGKLVAGNPHIVGGADVSKLAKRTEKLHKRLDKTMSKIEKLRAMRKRRPNESTVSYLIRGQRAQGREDDNIRKLLEALGYADAAITEGFKQADGEIPSEPINAGKDSEGIDEAVAVGDFVVWKTASGYRTGTVTYLGGSKTYVKAANGEVTVKTDELITGKEAQALNLKFGKPDKFNNYQVESLDESYVDVSFPASRAKAFAEAVSAHGVDESTLDADVDGSIATVRITADLAAKLPETFGGAGVTFRPFVDEAFGQTPVTPPEGFDEKLASWLAAMQKMVTEYQEKNFPTVAKTNPPKLEATPGTRYIRIVKKDVSSTSAFAFIDKTNGDVLKPDGWKTPAKHPRGNLFDPDNGLKHMGPYGPAYLR